MELLTSSSSAAQPIAAAATATAPAQEQKKAPPLSYSTLHLRSVDEGPRATELLKTRAKQARVVGNHVHVSVRKFSKSSSVVNFSAFLKDREKILRTKVVHPDMGDMALSVAHGLWGGLIGMGTGGVIGATSQAVGSLITDSPWSPVTVGVLGLSFLLAPVGVLAGFVSKRKEVKEKFHRHNFKQAAKDLVVVPILDLGDGQQLCLTPFGPCRGKADGNGDFYLHHLEDNDIKNFTLADLNAAIEKKADELIQTLQSSSPAR